MQYTIGQLAIVSYFCSFAICLKGPVLPDMAGTVNQTMFLQAVLFAECGIILSEGGIRCIFSAEGGTTTSYDFKMFLESGIIPSEGGMVTLKS